MKKLQFRIQSSLQLDNEIWQSTGLESDIHKVQYRFYWRNLFFSIITPFLPKIITVKLICLQNKSSLNKIGLIIHIIAARTVIDHIYSLLNLFVRTFLKESQVGLFKSLSEARKPRSCPQTLSAIPKHWDYFLSSQGLSISCTCQEVTLVTYLVRLQDTRWSLQGDSLALKSALVP